MTKNINEAAKSDTYQVVSTIAGGKAHRVIALDLLEDAEITERANSWSNRMVTRTLPAGTRLYYGAACGTARRTNSWMVYQNTYQEAPEVTCSKCLKHVDPVEEVEEVEEVENPKYTTRVGRKWTYVFLGDEEVAYVRNDQVDQVLRLLGA